MLFLNRNRCSAMKIKYNLKIKEGNMKLFKIFYLLTKIVYKVHLSLREERKC